MEQTMKKTESKKSPKRILIEIIEIVLIAFLLSWLLRTFVVEARKVPTTSMVPTIQVDDRLIVDKVYCKYFDEIKRGDIIVFSPPPEAKTTDDYIKRVIGLAGDKVEIRNHKTYVNDQPLDEPYVTDKARNDYESVVVPENSVFVMVDNRNNSADSREWGFVSVEDIIGRTLICYWPFSHFGTL